MNFQLIQNIQQSRLRLNKNTLDYGVSIGILLDQWPNLNQIMMLQCWNEEPNDLRVQSIFILHCIRDFILHFHRNFNWILDVRQRDRDRAPREALD